MLTINRILYDTTTRIFYANINGGLVPVGDGTSDGGGVTKVNTLPETGEAGKIYYNTSDSTYYVYNNDKFEPIAKQGMPNGEPEITGHYMIPGSGKIGASLTLQPNTYYNLPNEIWYSSQDAETPDIAGLTFTFNALNDEDIANGYVFRMVIGVESPNLIFTGVRIPDVTKEVLDNLEQGHEYEFNVFDKYMLVTDVTVTV